MDASITQIILQEFKNMSNADWAALFAPLLIIVYVFWSSTRANSRTATMPVETERILVVGASSGIGLAIATQYARRGAKVALMGRRKAELEAAKVECESAGSAKVLIVVGDFADPAAVLSARNAIDKEFGGLDTLVVAAGVSSLHPLVTGVAGFSRDKDGIFIAGTPTKSSIQRAKDVASKAVSGNYIGPLLIAVTFIPMLELTSKKPAVLLISSAASVLPAPTRSLYCSTKGAGLLLYQSLSIEHPKIQFSSILPSTVEGDFRASAVDAVVGANAVHEPVKGALKPTYVAERCIKAIDYGVKVEFLPGYYRLGHFLYWIVPGFVEGRARAKYNFKV